MKIEIWLKFSSDRQVKPGIEPTTPVLEGEWLIHYTTLYPVPARDSNLGVSNMKLLFFCSFAQYEIAYYVCIIFHLQRVIEG